ncbi:Non-specific lipid-transfer protein-like protein [Actinidia chinensis var. chinensis]|uniref:Non-specific lipid-transfer protein-like protein n=1 Tax=Actinidia chinensis var. chinensis TaxID=1590841 RepID=A0A2R6Q3I8_ACTCC|nr:Non-specific lipid-transfer protein-like protein [Actinidia chinensis var. chinensis]
MAHQRVRTIIVSQAKTFAYLHTILAMVIVLWTGATAQSSDCTSALISMSPCLNYITGNSSTPSSGCCQQLASVVRSQPQCLCEAVNGGGSSMGIKVNQTQALALPGACNVQTPSISRCNAASPVDSPARTTQAPNTIPSGTGSKTVPSTEDGSSDASSARMTVPLLFFLLFIASYASTSTIC